MLTQLALLVFFLGWSAAMVVAGYLLCLWLRPLVLGQVEQMLAEAKKAKERDELLATLLAARQSQTPPANQGS